jgi:hypothetical protein
MILIEGGLDSFTLNLKDPQQKMLKSTTLLDKI